MSKAGTKSITNSTTDPVNFYAQHPPEVFFIQQEGKDQINSFLLNFVPTDPNKEFGENGVWTGKLFEWNLTGDTVFIQDIQKSILKEQYAMKRNVENNANYKSNTFNQILSTKPANKVSDFWGNLWDALADFVGWIGSAFGLSTYESAWSSGYYNPDGGWRLRISFEWLTGGGATSSSDGGGGGYYYYGAGYPIYIDYIPGYGTPDGSYPSNSGSTNWNNTWNPCVYTGGGTSSAVMYLLDYMSITVEQLNFLRSREDIAQAFKNYFDTNGISAENRAFLEWALGYLTANQSFYDYIKSEFIADLTNIHSATDITEFKNLVILSNELFAFDNLINSGQFDFMNDDWLARLREKARRLSELPRNIAQNVKQKITAQLDAALVTSLKGTAKMIWPQVDGATTYYSAKLSEFNNNADHGVAILLWEFATGSGEDVWNFTYDQDITQKFITGRVLPEVFSDFYGEIDRLNLSYNDFKNRTIPLSTGLQFSPDQTSITESINKHLNSNLVQFFIGGAGIHYMSSSEDGWVGVSITNYTSRKSLLLHVADNYSRNASINQPLSTTQQNFTFKIKIDKIKFH